MKRVCPCCNEEITFRYFFKHLKNRRKNFFIENEVGLLCPNCKVSIISAERKNKKVISAMYLPMALMAIFGFTGGFSFSLHYMIELIMWVFMSFLLYFFFLYRIHQKIEYVCGDENSDEYNEYEQLTGMTKYWRR